MDKQELAQLLSDDSHKLKRLYDTYRTPFMELGSQYGLGEEVLAAIYQEAFITMYKRGIKGKLHKVSNSMHEYLLGIGKFMIYDVLKTNLREIPVQASIRGNKPSGETLSGKQEKIDLLFKNCAPQQQQLLKLFFYKGLNPEEIAVQTGHKNTASFFNALRDCLKALDPLIGAVKEESRQLLIQKHLKKRLTEKQQLEFDRLSKTEAAFKREVVLLEGLYKVIETDIEMQLRRQLYEFENQYRPYKKSSRLLWYVAASILVLLGMAYFFTIIHPTSTENLYADYFKPYKNVVHPVIKGVQVLDQKTKAFSTYENRDYKNATARFEALYNQTGDSYYLFYMANACMANNEVEKAVPLLEKHLESRDALQKKTLWYLALAYLKLRETEKADYFFKRIVEEEGYNSEKAKAIIKTLE